MSLAPSKRRPSAKPAIDLGHSLDGFAAVYHPDGDFLFRRIEQSLLQEASVAGGVTLDRIGYKTPALADIIVSVWQPGAEQRRA